MARLKHFLDLKCLSKQTLRHILNMGLSFKNAPRGRDLKLLAEKTVVMILEKPSTRTRVSFEIGIRQLGGHVIILNDSMSQLGRGETFADTARVLSRYADAIILRTGSSDKLTELEENSSVPIINGLTDSSHPCQIMADIMTYEEHRGTISGRSVAWVGDGNNVAVSWVHAAAKFGFRIHMATPIEFSLPKSVLAWAKKAECDLSITTNPNEAVCNADLVVTDTWISMGDTAAKNGSKILKPYQVNLSLMAKAAPDALFMHCLPAHRGKEVTSEVIDGKQSVVWDEAENRLHAQKGILAWCLT